MSVLTSYQTKKAPSHLVPFCLWQKSILSLPAEMPHVQQHAVSSVQQKPVASLQSELRHVHQLSRTQVTCVRIRRITHHLTAVQMYSVIICDQYQWDRLLQHEMTPPTGLQNNQTGTAAVSCVVKHEACSNGHRISKQTRPSCRDRCTRSESGLTSNRSKRFT